jgi:hypothetical protein
VFLVALIVDGALAGAIYAVVGLAVVRPTGLFGRPTIERV